MARTFEESQENPRGEQLAAELIWVHNIIRSDLQTISSVVTQLNAGASAEHIREQINELAANSAVWTLRVNCLRYCKLVHAHHHLEDAAMFPSLRCFHPALSSVVDKLEADHVAISNYLDQVEMATRNLGSEDSTREDLADALNNLATHLLTHLSYEEENISPTLRRMERW